MPVSSSHMFNAPFAAAFIVTSFLSWPLAAVVFALWCYFAFLLALAA